MLVSGAVNVVNKVIQKSGNLNQAVIYNNEVWRNNRHGVLRVVIVRYSVNSNAYVEPNETNAVMEDCPDCRLDWFTFLNFEKEQHFQYIEDVFRKWEQHRIIIDGICSKNWGLSRDVSYLIADFAEEKKMFKFDKDLLPYHYGTNGHLEIICQYCTLHKHQPILKIVDLTNEYITNHDESGEHLHAVAMAARYYDELEPWAVYDDNNDDNTNEGDDDVEISHAFYF